MGKDEWWGKGWGQGLGARIGGLRNEAKESI